MQRLMFFTDKECTTPFTTLGENEAGEPKHINFFVKNVSGNKIRNINFEITFPNITNVQINFPTIMTPGMVVGGSFIWHPPNNMEGEISGTLKASAQSIGI